MTVEQQKVKIAKWRNLVQELENELFDMGGSVYIRHLAEDLPYVRRELESLFGRLALRELDNE